MEEIFNKIVSFILPQNNLLIYLFLFLSAIFENLFPPMPGDTITVFGAFLVGTGRLNFWLVFLISTLGSVIGFMILFYTANYFKNKTYKIFSPDKIERAQIWFSKYGYLVVFVNRFLPGLRSVISIAAGFLKLQPLKVFFLSFFSATIWNFIWIYLGFIAGQNWEIAKNEIEKIAFNYNLAFFAIFSVVILFLILFKGARGNK